MYTYESIVFSRLHILPGPSKGTFNIELRFDGEVRHTIQRDVAGVYLIVKQALDMVDGVPRFLPGDVVQHRGTKRKARVLECVPWDRVSCEYRVEPDPQLSNPIMRECWWAGYHLV